MKKIWVHIRWFLIVIPLGLFSLTLFFVYPFAWLLRNVKNPLWIYLDDSSYENGELKQDYREWLNGRKDTLVTSYLWAGVRNRVWNLRPLSFLNPKQGREIVYGTPKGYLTRNDDEVSVLEFAAWKWIKDGVGTWQTNSGDTINWQKSTIGYSSVYYKVGRRLYYRYSRAWRWRDYFLNFKYGTNNERYLLTFKIQS